MQVINQFLAAGLEERCKKQTFGACPAHGQKPAYLSLCLLNGLVKLCLSCVSFSFLQTCIALQPKLLCWLLKPFLPPFSLSLFLICWSQLEASQVGLGQ